MRKRMTLAEFEERRNKLNDVQVDNLFYKMSIDDQRKFIDDYETRFKDRVKGIRADRTQLDLTNIAFSLCLLAEGKLWNKSPYKHLAGKPRGCYESCLAMVDNETNIHAGYGLNKGSCMVYPFKEWTPLYTWTPHAWLVNRKNKVIETTPDEIVAYLGIPVGPDELWYICNDTARRRKRILIGSWPSEVLSENDYASCEFDFKMPVPVASD
jgi:hypothetical protein